MNGSEDEGRHAKGNGPFTPRENASRVGKIDIARIEAAERAWEPAACFLNRDFLAAGEMAGV